MQGLFKATDVKFTAVGGYVSDYEMSCLGSTATMHRIVTQPYRVSVEAVASTNNAGELSSGWDLTVH
jgi:hypothetical protein